MCLKTSSGTLQQVAPTSPVSCTVCTLVVPLKPILATSVLMHVKADSCRDHIGQLYGSESDEILRYEALQDSVREAAGWVKMEDDFELVAESDMRDGASTRAELLQARRQVLLALDSVSCGETDAAAGLRDVWQQLDAAIAALDTGE